MTPRVALVASSSASEPGALLAARLRHLLGLDWDAYLMCKGKRWAGVPELRDPALAERVAFVGDRNRHGPPAALLRRPAAFLRHLRTPGQTGPFDGRLLALRPDLVHFHSAVAGWKGVRLRPLLGCPMVVSFREDGTDLPASDLDLLWENADRLVFPDAATLKRTAARGCPRDKSEVLHPPAPRVERPQERRPDDGVLRLLSAGPVVWEHGLEHSVHAVRVLLDMGIACRYRIVGDGDHVSAVAFAARQLGVTDHLELVPSNGDARLVAELRSSDVFVDPAVTATTSPSALVAAKAHGLPVVATGRAELSEDAGLIVPRRDPHAIAQALARLAADPDLRTRLGEAARRTGHVTLDDHLARLEALYREALT